MNNLLLPWVLPILGSALMLGIYDIFKKHAVRNNAVMPVLFLATLCGSIAYISGVAATGNLAAMWAIPPLWYLFLLLKSALVAASWGCVYYGLRDLPISIASPLRATSPVWTLIGGLIIFAEIPTWLQALGMVAIFGGYGLFSFIGQKEGFSFRHPGVISTLAGTILGAGSALFDKFLLGTVQIPPQVVQFHFALDLVLVLGAAWLFLLWRTSPERRPHFQWRWSIVATGVLLIVADALYFYAVSVPGVKISILALMRRSNVLVSFTLGGGIFHDKNMGRKALALGLILLGVAVLALAK